MLKHVQLNPMRSSFTRRKSDTFSVNSSTSFVSLQDQLTVTSRSSSYTSLNDTHSSSGSTGGSESSSTVMMRVYTHCLRPDLEYKTVSVGSTTTARQLVDRLLNKYRMKHRDPRLFCLTMEVTTKRTGVPVMTVLVLDDKDCPAPLQACYSSGARFVIRMRRGGLVKVYDSVLMTGSKYKSLLISELTTVDQLIQLLLDCYKSDESASKYCLHEQILGCSDPGRRLLPKEVPLTIQQSWSSCGTPRSFVLQRRVPVSCRSLWPGSLSRNFSMRCSFMEWSRSHQKDPQIHRIVEEGGSCPPGSPAVADYENVVYI